MTKRSWQVRPIPIYIYIVYIYRMYIYFFFFYWNAKPLPIRVANHAINEPMIVCVVFLGFGGIPSWSLANSVGSYWVNTGPNGDGFFVGKNFIQEKKNEQTFEKTNPWLLFFFKISQGQALGLIFFLASLVAAPFWVFGKKMTTDPPGWRKGHALRAWLLAWAW